MEKSHSTARRLLVNFLRLAVSAACIVITIRLIEWDKFWGVLARVDRTRLALLAPLLIVPMTFAAARWWCLLRANGFQVSLGRVFVLTYVGSFFNQFLPGAVGGDIARMVLTARGEDRKAAAATTVFLDRVMGLVAMIVVATLAVLPIAGDGRLRVPVLLVGGLFVLMVLGSLLYFSRGVRNSAVGRWVKGLEMAHSLRQIDSVFQSVRGSWRLVGITIALSVAAQVSSILVAYGLAHALGIHVGLLPFFLFEVIIFILTAVPVSMGGWGVQELTYAKLFGMVGVLSSEAVALSILLKLSLIVISLPGGVLFVLGLHRPTTPTVDQVLSTSQG